MIDTALVEKKLAFIETCVRELREFAKPERLAVDVREARFVEHTLQVAIQAALDVGPPSGAISAPDRSLLIVPIAPAGEMGETPLPYV